MNVQNIIRMLSKAIIKFVTFLEIIVWFIKFHKNMPYIHIVSSELRSSAVCGKLTLSEMMYNKAIVFLNNVIKNGIERNKFNLEPSVYNFM